MSTPMQITLMVPKRSSGSLGSSSSPNASPVKNYSPRNRFVLGTPRQPSPILQQRISDLHREASLRLLSSALPRSHPLPDTGLVQDRIKAIEQMSPKTEASIPLASPGRPAIGISKLNSTEKRGPLVPPLPHKKLQTPASPSKNDPLPPLPSGIVPVARDRAESAQIESNFHLIPGQALAETKGRPVGSKPPPKTVLVDQQVQRRDLGSLRNIGRYIGRMITPSQPLATSTSTTQLAKKAQPKPHIIQSLTKILTQKEGQMPIRQNEHCSLVVNTDDEFSWVNQEVKNAHSLHIKDSKETLKFILKQLKLTIPNIDSPDMEGEVLKNVDRLMENPPIRQLYSNNAKLRNRINTIYFKVIYGKLHETAKTMLKCLQFAQPNLIRMCEFIVSDQESVIKEFKNIYRNFPLDGDIERSIIKRNHLSNVCGGINSEETSRFVKNLFENPKIMVFATDGSPSYDNISDIIGRGIKACEEFKENVKQIKELQKYIDAMPGLIQPGGSNLTPQSLRKTRAQGFLDNYEIGVCIRMILSHYQTPLTNSIAEIPGTIKDIYHRTVEILKTHDGKIDSNSADQRKENMTRMTSANIGVKWDLIYGAINELSKFLPSEEPSVEATRKK